jgi:hypothetical protein
VGTFGGVLFYGFVAFLLGGLPGDALFLLRVAVLSAVYNAILTPLAYPLLRRVAETTRTKKVHRW